MHHIAEGVIAFSSEAAAERFGVALEAGGTDDVSLATVDSHALFRLTGRFRLDTKPFLDPQAPFPSFCSTLCSSEPSVSP